MADSNDQAPKIKRLPVRKRYRAHDKATAAAKRVNATLKKLDAERVQAVARRLREEQDAKLAEEAAQNQIPLPLLQSEFRASGSNPIKQTRKPNFANAFLHYWTNKMKEENPDVKLPSAAERTPEFKEAYNAAKNDPEIRQRVIESLEQQRLQRTQGQCESSRERSRDVSATLNRVKQTLKELEQRAGYQHYLIGAKGSPIEPSPPTHDFSSLGEDFFQARFNISGEQLAKEFEIFCMARGIEGNLDLNIRTLKVGSMKERITKLTSEGLRTILGSAYTASTRMEYATYIKSIVLTHGVILRNYPLPTVTSPKELKLDDIQKVMNALDTGKCHWEKVDPEELEEIKKRYLEEVANSQPRKRAPKKKKVADAANLNDEELERMDEGGDEYSGPPVASSSTHQPQSPPFISSRASSTSDSPEWSAAPPYHPFPDPPQQNPPDMPMSFYTRIRFVDESR